MQSHCFELVAMKRWNKSKRGIKPMQPQRYKLVAMKCRTKASKAAEYGTQPLPTVTSSILGNSTYIGSCTNAHNVTVSLALHLQLAIA